jgi:murein DD-endopeptidase MepM/ murein hydrolase activator NlpD
MAAALISGAPAVAGVTAADAQDRLSPSPPGTGLATDDPLASWSWPATSYRLVRPFVAPAHAYGPGHRGIDLDLRGTTEVLAPQDGVVAFVGQVAGRGIVTIDHGSGLVTTLEPVMSALNPGTAVRQGDVVGSLSLGGHTAPGTLHFGVRLDGEYINPLLLLADVPRAVLLPCC